MSMKRTLGLGTFVCFSFLVSCDENFDPATPVTDQIISKEVHYNFETNAKIGEKTFTYNNNGLLSQEYFTRGTSGYFKETSYEYDNDGNLLKKKERDVNTDGRYFVNEFTCRLRVSLHRLELGWHY